jgi:uncharacterized protein (TIGR02757 family)
MRLLFFGTSSWVVPILEKLTTAHTIAGVITTPDAPVGRKQIITASPIGEAALRLGLPLYKPKTLRNTDSQKIIIDNKPDAIVVASYGKIIPQDLKHRFNSAEDIGILLTLLGEALRKHESLEKTFENSIKKNDLSANATLSSKLESFIDELTGMNTGPYPTVEKSGAWFFFPRPSGGSACKRLLLFLKWMTGTGPMTLGLWKTLSSRELLVPVDTHILRLARHLGLTKKKQASWQTAEEISRALAVLTPEDPTRFDFALCHLGISKQCPSRFDHKICSDCKINSHCLTYGKRNNYIKRGKNHILEPAL